MRLSIQLVTPAGALILDCTQRAYNVGFSTSEHGCEGLNFSVIYPYRDAREFAGRKQVLHAKVFGYGQPVWSGRVDQLALTEGGFSVNAVGHYAALGDIPYLAMWSDTSINNWQELTVTNTPTSLLHDVYEIDFTERLYLAAKSNITIW